MLRRRFAGQTVVVVQTDAADLRLPRRPFRVVANPPFEITGPLLRRLTDPDSRLIDAPPRGAAQGRTGVGDRR